ncbi:hypothetical protein AMQ84_27190 [Paenibacillus riograndensis]|uniref:Uncharacterized protein n=1 Tax=Paenibacillus riograndensis TaxID=483937 RepID=A0A132TJZ2_9BACL|nr:hypothetical protein [Paenibacillus riograndensis]KWX71610.1 hypothetical protein AMQ84_27190 [Paenibacillus riograndensis]
MKRRVIKKWINRYITPLVKDMPQINCRCVELVNATNENERHAVCGENFIFVNGGRTSEGMRYNRTKGLHNDIKNTAKMTKEIIPTLSNPFLRAMDTVNGKGFYLRILDFKDWPEGYIYRPYSEER